MSLVNHINCILCRKTEVSPSVDEELSVAKASTSSESQVKDVELKPPRFPGEKDLSVQAKLAGVEITLADKHGELLTADTKGETILTRSYVHKDRKNSPMP